MRHKNRILFTASLVLFVIAASCTPSPIYKGHPRRKKEPAKPTAAAKVKEETPVQAAQQMVFSPPVMRFSRARINSGFGIRRHSRYHTSEFHTGIDIAAVVGEEVLASAPGRIIFTGKQGRYGKVVVIEHRERVCSVYAHLSAVAVNEGDAVAAGQYIANVGLTGNSTGAHLHFEIRVKDKAVDPGPYIQ